MSDYLVTGGCGFIGSHCVEHLIAEGHRVTVLDDLSSGTLDYLPPSVTFIKGSITDPECVAKAITNKDGCFHLAAIPSVMRSMEEWSQTHTVNVTGTINVFNAAKSARAEKPIPVIFASSAAVYGEHNSLDPVSPYGVDKLTCEWHAKLAQNLYGVPTCGLRFFNAYGERQLPDSSYAGVITLFKERMQKGLSIEIYGDGEQTRDFIYVKDIVKVMTILMSRKTWAHPEIFDVCSGQTVSINDLNKMMQTILKISPKTRYREQRQGDIIHSLGHNIKIKSLLGNFSFTPLEVGLKAMLKDTYE